jgi:plastocyanin
MQPMRVRGVSVLMAASLVVGATAEDRTVAQQRGSVRGRVEIGIPVTVRRPSAAYPTRSVAQPVLAPASELRHVVVFLKDAPAQPTEPMMVEIRQRDENFIPRVVAVPVGSDVGFPNDDPIYHNVFSLSRAKRFDLGRYAAGKSKGVRMDRPGVVRVFCDIHSHMSAFVLVFNHPFFDVTDDDGRFELPALPAGTYTLVGWYEGEARITRPVIVPPNTWAEIDLVVP